MSEVNDVKDLAGGMEKMQKRIAEVKRDILKNILTKSK